MTGKTTNPIKDVLKTVVYAIAIAVVVRTVGYEPFNIPSGSMVPTLLVGDYLFVSKWSYGYSRHSLPFSLPLIPGDTRLLFTEPERGDVAVFKLPTDDKTDYIKRLVGMPGDRIQVIDGVLHINGEAVKRERVGEAYEPNGRGVAVRVTHYVETLPNGLSHDVYERSDREPNDNTRVFTVPSGHYFAMGDNRDNSQDSRDLRSVGFIPRENLVGRAEFLFFSTDGTARWWEVWKWPFALRFSRLFDGIS